ncbi:hypothetical protein pb186bvf_020861 [Paramecium bursaria]
MKQKPIILSFPGWGTNAKFMKFQMGDLHDLISKQFEIEYLEPTFLIDSSLHVDPVMIKLIPPGEKIYRWGDKFMDMQQDVENAKKRILEDDRIIGLMGFSQGTCIVFDIGQQCHQNEELRKRIKFLILFTTSGLKPDKKIYNKQIPIRIPTLQTIGTKDFLYFENSESSHNQNRSDPQNSQI